MPLKKLIQLALSFTNFVLPPLCILCCRPSNALNNLCLACRAMLPILPDHCPKCARFLSETGICGSCLRTPPPFDRTLAMFPYESPIKELLYQFKFRHQLPIAKLLSSLMLDKVKSHWYTQEQLPQVIIPIPLHRSRLRQRGFNQAVELARPVAKKLAIPLSLHGVMRTRFTQPQTLLTKKQRKKNVQKAFKIIDDYSGCRLAVVDDVITTGSTMQEFCLILKQKHPSALIDVWCVARRS